MATPTADEISKLFGEVRGLKTSFDQSPIDKERIALRYNAAVTGLTTPTGDFDATAWNQLSEADREAKAAELASVKQTLQEAVEADPMVRVEPGSIMYKQAASNGWILFLTAFALIGLLTDLYVICNKWTEATSGKTVEKQDAKTPSVAATDNAPATATPAPAVTPVPSQTVNATAPVAPTAKTTRSPASETTLKGPDKPREGTVMAMVMLLGALGGFLRLASSMANYVGNRQLFQSWIIYYILTPVQGAALAPVVYLLLRVGVLNPANPSEGSASPTDSLNLIGIYAFAALTGLFSKQAIETLADVFSTIFKKVEHKDALNKSKPGKDKEKNES